MNEPQQAVQEPEKLVKALSADDKKLNFSAYTKKDWSKREDLSHISDQSDDSLENESKEMDDSFDREDVSLPPTQPASKSKCEKKKPKIVKDWKLIKEKVKENNQNIQNYLENSIGISIKNSKEFNDEKYLSTFTKESESESNFSLVDSENSMALRFYESGKDNGKH